MRETQNVNKGENTDTVHILDHIVPERQGIGKTADVWKLPVITHISVLHDTQLHSKNQVLAFVPRMGCTQCFGWSGTLVVETAFSNSGDALQTVAIVPKV